MPTIAITIDVEWAPRPIIDDMLAVLDRYQTPATLFCTDHPNLSDVKGHELAWHPNFREGESWLPKLHSLAKLYPKAQGIRGHCLTSDTRLAASYPSFGLRYDSSIYVPLQSIEPFQRENGLWQFPIYYVDHIHISMHKSQWHHIHADKFRIGNGLYVFIFHPVIWWLNASKLVHYEQAKAHYQNPNKLAEFRRPGYGIAMVFEELLETIRKKRWRTTTLAALAKGLNQ